MWDRVVLVTCDVRHATFPTKLACVSSLHPRLQRGLSARDFVSSHLSVSGDTTARDRVSIDPKYAPEFIFGQEMPSLPCVAPVRVDVFAISCIEPRDWPDRLEPVIR
jgi:hypothetical protein